MVKRKEKRVVRVGVDLDGVVARHSLGGFWVWARKFKEKILEKMHSSTYYYPATSFERLGWKVIDGIRQPFKDRDGLFVSLANEDGVQFYLVTSRFNFLEKMTKNWLKKHHLDSHFHRVVINIDDLDPFIFKKKAVKDFRLDFFIDDDLDCINYLKNETSVKLFWVVPGHKNENDNHDHRVTNCRDFPEALRKIFNYSDNS